MSNACQAPSRSPALGMASLWSHLHEQPPGYEKEAIGGSPVALFMISSVQGLSQGQPTLHLVSLQA